MGSEFKLFVFGCVVVLAGCTKSEGGGKTNFKKGEAAANQVAVQAGTVVNEKMTCHLRLVEEVSEGDSREIKQTDRTIKANRRVVTALDGKSKKINSQAEREETQRLIHADETSTVQYSRVETSVTESEIAEELREDGILVGKYKVNSQFAVQSGAPYQLRDGQTTKAKTAHYRTETHSTQVGNQTFTFWSKRNDGPPDLSKTVMTTTVLPEGGRREVERLLEPSIEVDGTRIVKTTANDTDCDFEIVR